MKLKNTDILKVYVANDDVESIVLAVDSFINNVEEVLCKCEKVNVESDANVIIKIASFEHPEEYQIEITKDKLIFQGNDDLGVIYSLYDFLENKLKTPPFYMIEGLKLTKLDEVVLNEEKIDAYPDSRYRGWFINDEDLLGSFKAISKRDVPDYPFYHDVINPDIMDMIAETALRYKLNLIIPSTLVNIMAPAERKLVEICSRRGLYVSQHHIEPLGVSKYGFKEFAKANGLNDDYSYLDNKDAMLMCYEAYAKEWCKFPRVIFQVGLRGAGDRPFWNNEKEITSDQKRGEIISSVIKTQVDLIKKYRKGEIIATSTLWMEGANLLRKNMLNIPKEVIVVFADVGMSQLFGDDFFEVKRDPSLKYGVYYHAGYCHTGPHLGEGVIPEKMEYSYHLAREKSSLYYSIINACNVKEHLFGLYLNSRLAFDHDCTAKRAINEYTSLYVKCPENKFFIEALKSFYNSLKDIGDDYYKDFCNKYNFSYHKYENLPFPIVNVNDGLFKAFIYNFYYEQREPVRKPIIKKICDEGYILMNDTLNLFNEVIKIIPNNYLDGFKSHWIYQCKYYIHLFKSMSIFYDACEEASKKNFDTCKNLFKLSSDELINILDDRKIYFKNDYSTWLDNDHKIDIPFLIRRILEDYDRVLQVNGLA